MLEVQPQRLTREAFAPFGDVIQIEGSNHFEINSGYTTRVHDLADVQLGGENASAVKEKRKDERNRLHQPARC